MEKKHIAIMMLFETVFTFLISITIGLFLGVVLDKLMYLILLKILHFNVKLGFSLSAQDYELQQLQVYLLLLLQEVSL